MGTIKDYFDTDDKLQAMSSGFSIECRNEEIGSITIECKQHFVFRVNAKYWTFRIPKNSNPESLMLSLLNEEFVKQCVAPNEGTEVTVGTSHNEETTSQNELIFTGKIIFYLEDDLPLQTRNEIREIGKSLGYKLSILTNEYAASRSKTEKPVAFLSHDSKDKQELARPLAIELSKLMCPVWYDEFSLSVGDSLRANIEEGLKSTKNCILVISPNFLANEGWGKTEFDSIFTREIIEKKNVFLPIWHNVTVEQVYQYSPKLADKFALNSDAGIESLAKELSRKIRDGA